MGKPVRKSLTKDGDARKDTYDYDKLKKEVFRIARETKAICISDVYKSVPMDKSTFAKYFPVNGEDRQELEKILEEKIVGMKQDIRQKLLDSGQSVGLIALYKLIGTEEERNALASTPKVLNTVKEDKEITLNIN